VLIWVLLIVVLLLSVRLWLPIVAWIVFQGAKVAGMFAVFICFWVVGLTLLTLAYVAFHPIAVWLGPQIMDDYVLPFVGLAGFAACIGFGMDSIAGWPAAKTVFLYIHSLLSSKTWTLWWRRHRVLQRDGTVLFYAPYLWLARLRASRIRPARIQKRKDLCTSEEIATVANHPILRTVIRDSR
jgi:hypothetical protein